MPNGGLKQKTDHYNEIYQKFMNNQVGFNPDRYCGDAIFKSNPEYILNYDSKQFKQSLARLVVKVKAEKANGTGGANGGANGGGDAAPPPTAAPTAAATAAPVPASATSPPPATSKFSTKTGTPKTNTPSASFAGIPVGLDYEELSGNDEYVLDLPSHTFFWKDLLENERVTAMVYLPLGVQGADVTARIVESGNQLEIEMVWPDIMTDPRLPMYAGTRNGVAFYSVGHVKVTSFRTMVQRIKNGSESNMVYSVFRLDLPVTVEEQFCDIDVPRPLAAVKYTVESKQNPHFPAQEAYCLVCEMVSQRTNYKDDYDVEDFSVDFTKMHI